MSRTISLLNRFDDPAESDDPRIQALVEALGRLDFAPAPREQFRTDLRAQLVAIAGRVVAEGEPTLIAPAAEPARLDPVAAANAARTDNETSKVTSLVGRTTARRRGFGRPIGVAAACVAVLALGLGGAVWKSQSALPGSSLYGLKRASEDVRLSLTSGDTARGHEYLRLATTRVDEARDLLGRPSALGSGVQAGAVAPQTLSLIDSTLRSADSDVTAGSSLLGTQAIRSRSAAPLAIMRDWAPGQLRSLAALSAALGSGPAHTASQHAWALVNDALHRARTLSPAVTHGCTSTRTDALGPTDCVATRPGRAHERDHAKRPSRNHHSSTSGNRRSGSGSTRHHRSTAPSTSHGVGTKTTPSLPTKLPTSLPTKLPTKLPSTLPTSLPASLPVSISSCGVSVSVGPIGVGLGSCSSGS